MRRRRSLPLAVVALLAISAASLRGDTIALLPVQQGVRDAATVEQVEMAVRLECQKRGDLIDSAATRAALRRLRLRSSENASPGVLQALAEELRADWLLAVHVLDAAEGPGPDLAMSARLYDRDGLLAWSAFAGHSGLDSRTLLGIGEIRTLAVLTPVAVAKLLAPWGAAGGTRAASGESEWLGRVALVPFTAPVPEDGLAVATAATEATRAMLAGVGAALVAPGCVADSLRLQRSRRWGELSADARRAIRTNCAADTVVTGSVERWEATFRQDEPAPIVTVALRVLDAESGRILWMGSREAGGADHGGLFGWRRIYSRGGLLSIMLDRLGREMVAAGGAELQKGER